jgi:hypothetical protein
MTLFDKAGRPAAALLGIAMLAGLLLLGGCSNSTTSSAYGSGDKRDDPALKAQMKGAMEAYKAKSLGLKKGNPSAAKRPG